MVTYMSIMCRRIPRRELMPGYAVTLKRAVLCHSHGCGVERVFPLHSPNVDKVEIVRQGRVRRAKLYYLRDRVGKAAKVKSKIR